MMLEFSGPEALEMALQTEEGGKRFYETVAARIDDQQLRGLFGFLAAEEARHIAAFREIARSLKERPEESPYNWEEAVPYLRAVTESRYFLGKDKALSLAGDSRTPLEAVEHALGFEKETLLFYTEILSMVSDRTRPAVERLIQEEKAHVVKLANLKEALNR